MVDGFYRIAFTGTHGSGFGLIVLREGVVAGADVAGATYDGAYELNSSQDGLDLRVTMRAPAGITPVRTGVPLSTPTDISIAANLPVDLANGEPVLIETPLGRVNVAFLKIRDF